MMNRLMGGLLVVALAVGCNSGGTVTGPDVAQDVAQASAPTTTVAEPPAVAPPITEGGHIGTINGASFNIENNTNDAALYVARIYEVFVGGEQQLREEIRSGNVLSGQAWAGRFASLPCNYQIDLDHYFEVKNHPAPGEIAHKIVTGNVCPQPTPSPSPTPTPEPECVEEWIAQEPVRENVGDYGECSAVETNGSSYNPPTTQCAGRKSRTYDEVVYEINSCTEDRREKSRTEKTEYESCLYQCLAAICHTENKKYCGTRYTRQNGQWGWYTDCWNDWFLGSDKRWQCQNVPPGTPGHYDNHFDTNGHDDFFGSCGEVGTVTDKCYNITN